MDLASGETLSGLELVYFSDQGQSTQEMAR